MTDNSSNDLAAIEAHYRAHLERLTSGSTHYDGCWKDHYPCAILALLDLAHRRADETGTSQPTEMRPTGENHSTAVRTGAHRESGETGSAGGPSQDRICEQPEAAHGDGCRSASAQCKHDWVGDDNCAYCRAEDAEAEAARLRAHIFNGEEFVLDLVNAEGEPPTELLVWAREWVACNLGAEPDDVRLAKEKEGSK